MGKDAEEEVFSVTGLHNCHNVTTYLRVEEYLWPKEAFVPNVNLERFLSNRVHAIILLDPFGKIVVILAELLDYVGTDVAISLLRRTTHKLMVNQAQTYS